MAKSAAVILGMLMCGGVALAQGAGDKTISQVLDSDAKMIEGEFVSAAEAMPEDKYAFAPSQGEFKGVRTFADQIKHGRAQCMERAERVPARLRYGTLVDCIRPTIASVHRHLQRQFTAEDAGNCFGTHPDPRV